MTVSAVDSTLLKKECDYRSFDVMFKEMLTDRVEKQDKTRGSVRLLVLRPGTYMRHIVREARFTVEGGMEGSGWQEKPGGEKADQICVMSVDAIRAVTNSDDENVWAAAGDQIFMDFDLSKENLQEGDRVVVGDEENGVILVVTARPHNGCAKFSTRYGIDALKIVNCPQGKKQRLRGIYFKVVREGVINEGDEILKI